MKITLKELRSIIRESIQKHLTESPEMTDEELIKAAIKAQMEKNKENYSELKSKIENRINELKLQYSQLPPGDKGLARRGILPAQIGNLQRALMSPSERSEYDRMTGEKYAAAAGLGGGEGHFRGSKYYVDRKGNS